MRSLVIRGSIVISSALLVFNPHQSCAFEEPYCGLYSLYAALHAIGIEVEDFNDMSVPEYLSGTQGSTALDLIRLAEKYGATGTFQAGTTVATLRAAESPVLLHTSVVASQVGFHHWVLFRGMDGNSVKLYDPPRGMYTVSAAELLSFWDGSGITVQRGDNRSVVSGRSWLPVLNLELILAFLLVLIGGGLAIRVRALVRHPVCSIFVVALVSATVWHAAVDYGFFGNGDALANISSRFHHEDLPIIFSNDQFCELIRRHDVTIVDARRPDSFKISHIPDAVNVPITVTHGELRDALERIPTENQVVVYCQSKHCGWADDVADQFSARGYRHVAVFRGGMNAWETITAAIRQ